MHRQAPGRTFWNISCRVRSVSDDISPLLEKVGGKI